MKNLIFSISIVLFVLGFTSIATPAQKNKPINTKTAKVVASAKPVPEAKKKTASVEELQKMLGVKPENVERLRVVPNSPALDPGGAVEVPPRNFEKLHDETLTGNVTVDVSANGNSVIKIGLADRAVTLVDFPVNDPVYKIHPGNENFVTVGCVGRTPEGKCQNLPTDVMVLRPGKDFHALGSEDAAATVITVQRVSGIVVTFLVVPVKSISENTNYVAVRYNLADVLQSRRSSGLAINLRPDSDIPNASGLEAAVRAGKNNILESGVSETGGENAKAIEDSPESLDAALVKQIQRIARSNPSFKFSKPIYGIALARASGFASRTSDVTVEVVAVRNTLPAPIRLVPDQPELVIENTDAKESSVNVQPVNILYTATSADDDDVLQPGQIYYFAFAYKSPILGVKQHLRASFAQREASDQPATIILGAKQK